MFQQVPSWFWQSIDVTKSCINNRESLDPNLWALWGNALNPIVISVSDRCIGLEIVGPPSSIYMETVYASTHYLNHRQLWADLTHLQGSFQGPWLFIGDFNVVLQINSMLRILRHNSFLPKNTSYFHRVSKVWAASKNISILHDGDSVITEPNDIEVHMLAYFQSILSVDNNCSQNNLIHQTILMLVTDAENEILLRLSLREEIKIVVFYFNGDDVPGPDGFGGHFYQIFWDIVETNVVQSVQEFFYFIYGVLAPKA